ncbi:MAG: hypothetical protein ACPLTR_08785 [Thermacetogeniaceae bacterium]
MREKATGSCGKGSKERGGELPSAEGILCFLANSDNCGLEKEVKNHNFFVELFTMGANE